MGDLPWALEGSTLMAKMPQSGSALATATR